MDGWPNEWLLGGYMGALTTVGAAVLAVLLALRHERRQRRARMVADRLSGRTPHDMVGAEFAHVAASARWDRRLLRRLFPARALPPVNSPLTYIITAVHVRVSWADRLRLLASGRARINVRTYTDVEVKQAASVSAFEVEAPW